MNNSAICVQNVTFSTTSYKHPIKYLKAGSRTDSMYLSDAKRTK